MIQCFLDGYTPNKILHRGEQEEAIKATFQQFKTHGVGTNLSLIGVTGGGKTATINKLLREFNAHIYFSADMHKTSFKILRELSQSRSRDYPTFIKKIIERLKTEKKILIIDELNKVEDARSFFDALNTIYRQTGAPIIVISNNRKIFMEMPEDARLTLFFHKVEFPAYSPNEIKDIINSRLELLSHDMKDMIPIKIIEYISRICSGDGSARDALDFTMKCILRNCFTKEFVDSLIKEKRRQEWQEFAKSLSGNQITFLNALIHLHRNEKEITNRSLRKYMPELSPQSISMHITDFGKYGILDYVTINKGRKGGRYRVVTLDHDAFCKLEGIVD